MTDPVLVGSAYLSPGRGGIAAVARLTAKVLGDMGHEPRLVTLLDEEDGEIGGAKWTSVRGSRAAFVAQCHWAAVGCQRFVYDGVGTARAHPRIAPLRRPYAVWMHGIEAWYELHKDRARALRGADLVLVNSQATLDRFRALHGDLDTAEVCWLATEADEPSSLPSLQDRPTVLILGTLDMSTFYKGHKELIACWSDVVAAVPDARLVIAGGGNALDHVRALASASPAGSHIEVKGFVPQDAVAALWQQAHVFAMPSRNEGFGIVYAEAMRHRLPVIASVHDAGREVNVDGVTGFNVDLDAPDELAERLIRLLTSPKLARRMGANGQERWHQNFRYSAFERRLGAILRPFLRSVSA